jgi:uncharacterized sulfatase
MQMLLVNADGSGAELYNVVTDRSESRNVANAHPDLVKRMTEQTMAWRSSLPRVSP